jgi:glutaryl-CoA dehydrogenase
MTVNVTLPTTPQPYLWTGALPADFYAYEELLSNSEREKVDRIRDFFRTEVAPVVDD